MFCCPSARCASGFHARTADCTVAAVFAGIFAVAPRYRYRACPAGAHPLGNAAHSVLKGIDRSDMEKLAASIVDTLSGEHYIKAVVGIGTPIANVKDLATSFKEAQIAMEVSKVFDNEKEIIR